MIVTVLKSWLPLAVAFTLLCGIIYAAVQQTYRSSANDPQYQMAESAVTLLNSGTSAKYFTDSQSTDISKSLKPYLIIYDDHGNPIASNGVLDGKIPEMPIGVLDYTREHGGDAITWQPRPGVRSALVILPFQSSAKGFVVAGRSLRLVEEREGMLIKQIELGWIISLALLLIVIAIVQVIFKP